MDRERRPVYRKGDAYAARVRKILVLAAHPERDVNLEQYELAVIREVRKSIPPRALAYMHEYYVCRKNTMVIGEEYQVNVSSVSRAIRKGEKRLDMVLRLAENISPLRSTLFR